MKTPDSDPAEDFGLVAWLEATRVKLPLKGVECRFEVTGAVASVELDQIYHQENRAALDCTYLFPLPAGAAVYRCEIVVNGRVIRAVVEKEQAAQALYAEKKSEGRRVAMVESERENLFTLSLGNVQPGDLVVVRLAWFQVLDRVGEGLRLLIPTCPGVRYIPGTPLLRSNCGRGIEADTDQVPDASRITPPRIEALHPEAAYFALSGRFSRDDVAAGSASSSTHAVLVREEAGTVTLELAAGGAVPDRDFVVVWREPVAQAVEPQAWCWRAGEETYALLQLRAPEGVAVAENFAQDFYFLVDRSTSMEGRKWEQACRAVHGFVDALGAQDRVWITMFASEHDDFSEEPMPAPELRADPAFQRLVEFGADGDTELRSAAEHVLHMISRHSKERPASLVLITDGQVGNESLIMEAFYDHMDLRVHTFGIDTAVNDAFLKELAAAQGGSCWLQTPDDDIAGTVAALGARLRRPVLRDLKLAEGWRAADWGLTDLHAGEVATVVVRSEKAPPPPLVVRGHLPDGREHVFDVALARAGTHAVQLLWVRQYMARSIAFGHDEEAVKLAREHNVLCAGTVFIAWDDAEQGPVAKAEVVQPSLAEPPRKFLYTFHEFTISRLLRMPPFREDALLAWGDRVREETRPGSSRVRADGSPRRDLAARLWEDEVTPLLLRMGFWPEELAAIQRALEELDPRDAGKSERARRAVVAERIELMQATAVRIEEAGASLDPALRRKGVDILMDAAGDFSYRAFQRRFRHLCQAFWVVKGHHTKLREHGVPPAVVQALLEWVLRDSPGGLERSSELCRFLEALKSAPETGAAPGSRVALWQEFLDRSVGRDSAAYAAAQAWLPELEPPGVPAVKS
jgi:Ca-activated chloride channel family protein